MKTRKNIVKNLLAVTVLALLVSGCSNTSGESTTNNVYMNNDSKCVKVEKVYKDYIETEPSDLLEVSDYCVIGRILDVNEGIVYDNGKLRTELIISIDEIIKGVEVNEMTVLRDGGRLGVSDYLNIEGGTYLETDLLEKLPDEFKKSNYVEIVPSAYFKEELNKQYLFFIKNGEVMSDAYGMLEVNVDKVKNIYTGDEYLIEEIR